MPYIDIDPAEGNRLADRMLYYFFFGVSTMILAFFAQDYFSSAYSLYTTHWDIMTYELYWKKGLVFTVSGFVLNIIILILLVLSLICRKRKGVLLFGVLTIALNILLCFIYYLLTVDMD